MDPPCCLDWNRHSCLRRLEWCTGKITYSVCNIAIMSDVHPRKPPRKTWHPPPPRGFPRLIPVTVKGAAYCCRVIETRDAAAPSWITMFCQQWKNCLVSLFTSTFYKVTLCKLLLRLYGVLIRSQWYLPRIENECLSRISLFSRGSGGSRRRDCICAFDLNSTASAPAWHIESFPPAVGVIWATGSA